MTWLSANGAGRFCTWSGGSERELQLGDALPQRVDLVLELDDPAYALEAEALGGQPGDLAEQLDVAQRVATSATARTSGDDELEAVVRTQRLRMQARELGGNADDEDLGLRSRRHE